MTAFASHLFEIFAPIHYPRVVCWGELVGEISADGREIETADGTVFLPVGAIVRDATRKQACDFYSAREAASREKRETA